MTATAVMPDRNLLASLLARPSAVQVHPETEPATELAPSPALDDAPAPLPPCVPAATARPHAPAEDLIDADSPSRGAGLRPEQPPSIDGAPAVPIVMPTGLTLMSKYALWILRELGLYAGPAGSLVEVADDGSKILPVGAGSLLERLNRGALWFKVRKDEKEPELPPRQVVATISAMTEFPGFPRLDKIQRSPYYYRDRTGAVVLNDTDGYHEPTKTFLWRSPSSKRIAVREAPTRDEARAALSRLLYLLRDFEMDDLARCCFVAACLSVPLRAVVGPTPLFLFMANRQGAGKSILQEILSIITIGSMGTTIRYAAEPEEFRKAILAVLIGGPSLISIDNVVGILGGAALASLLTGLGIYADRILGRSEMIAINTNCVVTATGNNCTLDDDLQRRTQPIRLRTDAEFPETRSGFSEPRLIKYVRSTRAEFAADVLTIARAYIVAGQPDQGLPNWGGFEGYTALIRNAIVFAGGIDPALAREELKTLDTSRSWLARFLVALKEADPQRAGLTTAEIVDKHQPFMARQGALGAVLEEIKPPSGNKISLVGLGRRLAQYLDQNAGGLILRRREDRKTKNARWFIEEKEMVQ